LTDANAFLLFSTKKASSGSDPEEASNNLQPSSYLSPHSGAGISTFSRALAKMVAKASQGLFPPPFLIREVLNFFFYFKETAFFLWLTNIGRMRIDVK